MSDEKKAIDISDRNVSPEKLSQSTNTLVGTRDKEKVVNEDPDTQCGLGSWTPRWLQRGANTKMFLFFYSMAGLSQGAQFAYLVGCMSTMEKRFEYDTKKSALIMIVDEIPPIIFGALIGYFGGKMHRPRLLAFGVLLGSISSFLMAAPYFIYGASNIDNINPLSRFPNVKAQFCDKDFNSESRLCSKSIASSVLSILILGNLFKGFASTIYYTIGTPYIDDGVKKKNSPLYLGTLFAFRLLGPTSGFLLSSLCLSFYENPFYDPGYGPKDPRWVGAWWMGFIILGVAIFIFSLPMLLFPKRFPGTKPNIEEKQKEKGVSKPAMEQLKDMGKALKRLGKNPILICHYLGGVLRLNGLMGYYVLLPKYMEMQFKQSASKASLYSGPAGLIGMQLGILFGGIAIRKFKPRPRVLTGVIVIVETFSFVSLVVCMLITCPVSQMTGTGNDLHTSYNLSNSCNEDCFCTTKVYTPVCGPDGTTNYFSPCHAGCSDYNKTDDKEYFTDCKCVHDEVGGVANDIVTKGYCDSGCQWMVTFIIVLSIGKLIASTARVGNALVTLRCVDPADKSLALGTLSGIFSLLAFIPYPLVYGALTDASCLVWEESCGKTGNCWIYDIDKFRFLLHGVSACFVFLGCVTDVFVCILSPKLKNLYDDVDDKEGQLNDQKVVASDDLINNGDAIKTGVPKGSVSSLVGQTNS